MASVTPLLLRSAVSGPSRQAVRTLSRRAASSSSSRPTSAKLAKGLWVVGGAVSLATAFTVMSEPTLHLDSAAPTPSLDPAGRIDPSTNFLFPLALSPLSIPSEGLPLSLVGLGVRTVSFLSVKVYSVGFYTNCRMLGGVKGNEESMTKFLAGPAPCALRIIPTRNTGFDHLRDGFVRSMQGRFKVLSKQGLLSEEENASLDTAIIAFKSIFNAASTATKGQTLLLVKLPNNAGIAVEFEGELLGKVESKEGGVLARELMTGYFVDKNANSPKMRDSVRQALGL